MDPLRDDYRTRLITCMNALGDALPELEARSPEVESMVGKITRALRVSGERFGYPQITAATAPFESAPGPSLPMLVRRLLRVLEGIVTSGWDTKLKLLVIDGDEESAQHVAGKLQAPNRELLVALSAADAWRVVDEHEVALVVLDLVLPDVDGRNLVVRLRADPRTTAIPIVVLSDWGSRVQAECFALGVDHVFAKPCDLDLLAVAVALTLHRSLEQVRDSHHDALTNLLSREGLRDKLQRSRANPSRKGEPISLAVLDLELSGVMGAGFSHVEILHRVASVVLKELRPSDSLARWGELELVALLDRTSKEGAARALERVRDSVEETVVEPGIKVDLVAGIVEVEEGTTLQQAVAEADRALFTEREARQAAEAPPGGWSARRKVLIVDPEEETAFVVRRLLEPEGFEILHHGSGSDALRSASIGGICLAILDLKLPDVDGLDLLGSLRAMPMLSGIPIVIMTALGRDLDVARAFERGADDYVLKPCSSTELVARIRRLLKRSAARAPLVPLPGKAGAMAGLYSGDQLFEFVQMIGLGRRTGRLVLSSESLSGQIDFYEGRIVGGRTSRGGEGLEATKQLLTLGEGKFEFWPGIEATTGTADIEVPVDGLLLDVLRKRDESGLTPG